MATIESQTVKCGKCNGFLVAESLYDIHGGFDSRTNGFRCVNCGDIISREILFNRLHPPENPKQINTHHKYR